MKPALLIVDMNKGNFKPTTRGGVLLAAKNELVASIHDLVTFFRGKNFLSYG